MPLPTFVQPLGHGIFTIDTGFAREGFDAAYLIVHRGRAAFVDTGPNLALPRLLSALDELSVPRSHVDWVIPTHVHLDHAGGVGALIEQLPNAQVLVHPRGVRHLVDPSALYKGALAVYGPEVMARDYGELRPVPEARVHGASDNQRLELMGRKLLLLQTPGHAHHHHCIWDETSGGMFTGDTFGLSYRELDSERGPWMLITSTPVQFDPKALRASIARLLSWSPTSMYLTHFGRVENVPTLAAQELQLLDDIEALGYALRDAPERHRALKRGLSELYEAGLRKHGCRLSPEAVRALLAGDIELNAQGMGVWLDTAGA